MIKKIALITLVSFLFYQCSIQPDKTQDVGKHIKQLSWILGEWQNELVDGLYIEVWKKQTDTNLIGQAFILQTPDTIFTENVSLIEHGEKLTYKVSVNGTESVEFSMTSISTNRVVFENPKHDFPQKITYSLITPDSIFAQIEGKIEGKVVNENFPMKKVRK